MNHTKEPWHVEYDDAGYITINDDTGYIMLFMKDDELEMTASNAQRIVACVNACVGITDEALKNGVIKEAMELFWRVSDKAVLNENNQMTYNGKTIFISDMEDV